MSRSFNHRPRSCLVTSRSPSCSNHHSPRLVARPLRTTSQCATVNEHITQLSQHDHLSPILNSTVCVHPLHNYISTKMYPPPLPPHNYHQDQHDDDSSHPTPWFWARLVFGIWCLRITWPQSVHFNLPLRQLLDAARQQSLPSVLSHQILYPCMTAFCPCSSSSGGAITPVDTLRLPTSSLNAHRPSPCPELCGGACTTHTPRATPHLLLCLQKMCLGQCRPCTLARHRTWTVLLATGALATSAPTSTERIARTITTVSISPA